MSNKLIKQSVIEIVKAYVAGNKLSLEELPRLVAAVRDALSELERPRGVNEEKVAKPVVNVRRSVGRHRIVCLEDGKKFKALKRHLSTAHGLTPEEYRAKWGLEASYPMVAPAYSARRAQLAAEMGLGRHDRRKSVSRTTGKGQLTDAA